MNISYEFSKVKDAFIRVRDDMAYLTGKLGENYDEFMSHHKNLAQKVELLSSEVQTHIKSMGEKLHPSQETSTKEVEDLKLAVKDLKKEIELLQEDHGTLTKGIDSLKKSSSAPKDYDELKEKVHNSELELYLLKERMLEKDVEIKQVKDISKRLFTIVDELSKAELELLKHTK